MLKSARILLLSLALHGLATGAPEPVPAETAKKVEALVEKLPTRTEVRSYQQRSGKARHDGKEKEAAELEGKIIEAGKIANELRGLIATGTSVFSYPGLLAAGEISYVTLSGPSDEFGEDPFSGTPEKDKDKAAKTVRGYALDIGVPIVTHQEFRVLFDESGVIVEIRLVPNKR